MKMLNMNKVNGPANTSFYYPQSTRNPSSIKHGNASNTSSSLLNGSNVNMSHTLKNTISGKALFTSS